MILVVGAGAVGSFLGSILATGGADVVLLGRPSPEPVRPASLTLVEPDGSTRTLAVARGGAADSVAVEPDLAILAVKMADLAGALDVVARWPAAAVLAVENGIGADELVAVRRPAGGLIAGSLTTAVELDGETVRRLSRGGIALAPVHWSVGPGIAALAARFEAGGLRVREVPDAAAMRWSKLLVNLVGNATSAILDVDPATVYRDRALFALERRQLREALEVMRRLGIQPIRLPGADARLLAASARLPDALVRPVLGRIVAGGRGGKDPSLRRHVRSGRPPTEAAWLNGSVDRAARTIGFRAPLNARLAELVDEVAADPDRRAWFRARPDRLLAELPR
ncbi:MAG: ketopantoate reductase family protein [Candidatus Limnocylindrales bacterium]